MSFRVLVITVLVIAFALWREVKSHIDYSRFIELSQARQSTTVNGVLSHQSLSREIPSGKDLLTYRLAPPPGWSAYSFPSLPSDASTALVQSAGLTPSDSPASRASSSR